MFTTDEFLAVMRAISLDPGSLSARDELTRIVSAWMARQRRRTEIAPAIG